MRCMLCPVFCAGQQLHAWQLQVLCRLCILGPSTAAPGVHQASGLDWHGSVQPASFTDAHVPRHNMQREYVDWLQAYHARTPTSFRNRKVPITGLITWSLQKIGLHHMATARLLELDIWPSCRTHVLATLQLPACCLAGTVLSA